MVKKERKKKKEIGHSSGFLMEAWFLGGRNYHKTSRISMMPRFDFAIRN